MFTNHTISFEKSGSLNRLVSDYLNKSASTSDLYAHEPNINGFKKFASTQAYAKLDRNLLFQIINGQQQHIQLSEQTKANLLLLKEQNTFTVTTGHQLCLFTGPLYFIHKILSTIKLCEQLKKELPECNFVPVYWMASEDHDFAEVNHFHLFGKTIQWQSNESGAVGMFDTKSLQTVYEELKSILGAGAHAIELSQLFDKAYLQNKNLSDATRYLANALFAHKGLVIVDGHDKQFKQQFIPLFEKDIFEMQAYQTVSKSIGELQARNYPVQVNPREINCFLLGKQQRNRIEFKDGMYHLVGRDQQFTADELKNLLHQSPELFSPNVVLRPLYQQLILPNIAYVGGPGELAYWLEFKHMFDSFGLNFPILVPRNFITVVEKGLHQKIEKLKLSPIDFFQEENHIIEKFQIASNATFSLNSEKAAVEGLYAEITKKMLLVDKSLSGSIMAECQKTINSILALEGKANKALKQKSETEINQIKNIKQKLFPGNIPQERHDNFAALVSKFGLAFIDDIYQAIEPLEFAHRLMIEQDNMA